MSEPFNLEELSLEKERLNKDNTFLDQFIEMLKGPGTKTVRLLPPPKGGKLYQYNRVHAMNGRKLHCRRPLVNGKWDRLVPCPICDLYHSLWKQADRLEDQRKTQEAEALKDEAREIKPVPRYYYNAVDRKHTNKNGDVERNVGPRILSVGVTLHKKIIETIVGGDDVIQLGNVTDINRGYDFIIRKQLKGEFPDYGGSEFAREPSPLGSKEEVERWREQLHDLSKLRNPKTVEQLEREIAIYKNIIPDDDDFDLAAIERKFRPKEALPEGDVPTETSVAVDCDSREHAPTENDVSEPDLVELADPDFMESIREDVDLS